ncbi:MAG: ATP-binding protein, partial [Actinobacteria bacterium]|nr:ATP-binding protein [Actinomycetota bacterium]
MSTTPRRRCQRCGTTDGVYPHAFCPTCQEWYGGAGAKGEPEAMEVRRQLSLVESGNGRMRDWSIWTFDATDDVGRAALEAVEPWLAAHTQRCLDDDDVFVKIDDRTDPRPDDHPIWTYFNADLRPDLYIWGPVGSGKSGLAWSLLRARIWLNYDYERRGEEPAWANVVQLLDAAKAAMSAGERSPIRELYGSSVLVLDDLGAERVTDWARDAIAALVQHRHVAGLATIVTSNYAPSALAARLGHDDIVIGKRIVSRLTENCIQVHLKRADLRARKVA